MQVPPCVHVPLQPACVVTLQLPSLPQQEPVGCGQVLGSQTPPLVQVPVQADWIVTVQPPSVAQHEPVCTQFPLTQTWPVGHWIGVWTHSPFTQVSSVHGS